MKDSERCEMCGSWEAECVNENPVADCGCSRCAQVMVRQLRSSLAKILSLLESSLDGLDDDDDTDVIAARALVGRKP